jgi:hypothetical protein
MTWFVYSLVFVLNAVVFSVAGGPTVVVVLSACTGLAALTTAVASTTGRHVSPPD